MKTTLVLSLDEDTAAFVQQLREQSRNEDPSVIINRLLRQEQSRMGMPARQNNKSSEEKELERFVDEQIPSAG